MIKNIRALDLSEMKKVLGSLGESERKKQIEPFIKKFSKISKDKAEQLKKELSELELLKLKQEHLVKIVDLLPEDALDLNKIFTDVSLNEDETNKILEIIKKYK
jgi:DNA-directed RNA polymerase subunit F